MAATFSPLPLFPSAVGHVTENGNTNGQEGSAYSGEKEGRKNMHHDFLQRLRLQSKRDWEKIAQKRRHGHR
ncbi:MULTISPECIES: hypothetical protein [unclassified Polaromonas]|uniref:hypothetical protein n=1 Tax=unclassified Polaromonas TaxID=2638319 RepID=UPI00129D8D2A|nr:MULTISPECIES: hypothetical protein [unclassified Polaromonas]QGJ17521.1 hypothetical protein F7R28_03370 [Polaromonas sp. Pch-P]